MEELINRVVQNVGLDPAIAEKAVGLILGFLQKNGPEGAVSSMFENLPGAADPLFGSMKATNDRVVSRK